MGSLGRGGSISRRGFLESGSSIGLALALGANPFGDPASGSEIVRPSRGRSVGVHRLTILHTTDMHGQVDPHGEFFWEDDRPVFRTRGGFASLKTLFDRVRSEPDRDVLLVDGGDCFHGSAVAALSGGRALVPLINALGYDLVIPGNWEVVYGKRAMMGNFGQYHAAKTCANMYHDGGVGAGLLFPPFQVFNLGGTRVGFIGYTDPLTAIRQSPDYSRGIRFTRPEASLARHVEHLRSARGCSLVFVLSHLGLAQQLDLANASLARGVDYVLGGDTHERIRDPIQERYARVTEPGAFASFVGRLDLALEDGTVKEERYSLLEVDPERYPPNAELTGLVERAKAPYRATADRVIGRTTRPLLRYYVLETPLDNLITDALQWRFRKDLVVSNGFRFCPPLVPGPDGGADITMDYLWSMLPVDSTVKTAVVTGAQIHRWLERELENVFADQAGNRFGGWFVRFNGMRVRFRIKAPSGHRLEEVTIGGQPLDPARTYSMLACEREGDPDTVLCRMKGVRAARRLEVKLHDVIVDYLGRFSPVAPVIEGRAVAVDAEGTLLSQMDGAGYRFR